MSSLFSVQGVSRRDALKTLAAGAAGLALSHRVFAQESPPKDPIRLAFVGVAGQGAAAVKALTDHVYVAFADVDEAHAAETYSMFPDVPRYRDFRVMLDRHAREIDAVIISTPDHAHYPVAMRAMAAGKHVYIEKPLASTIWECRELQAAALRHGVKAQMGIQGHSLGSLQMLREWIDAGVAGEITSLHLWTDRMQPHRYHWSEVLAPGEEVPSTLDWPLWLAGRPMRPFSREYVPNRWRNWWSFGTSPVGDIGTHMFDIVETALGLGFPEWVEADIPAVSAHTAPPWSVARWHFAARGSRRAIDLHWSNGTREGQLVRPVDVPRVPHEVIQNLTNGIVFVGTEGSILIEDMRVTSRPRFFPLEREREILRSVPRTHPRPTGNHYEQLFAAIRKNRPPNAHLDYGAPLTEVVLLGTLAQRLGRRVHWDRDAMSVRGVPEAASMIRPDFDERWWQA